MTDAAAQSERHGERQALLHGELIRVRRLLERRAGLRDGGRAESGPEPASPERARGPAETGSSPTLDSLRSLFALSSFELDVLLVCAGVELEPAIRAALREIEHDPAGCSPTFRVAVESLEDPHWSALAASSPLRRWRLIDVGRGSCLVDSPLRIDERVLSYLIGVRDIDERLGGFVSASPVAAESLTPRERSVAGQLARLWWSTAKGSPPAVVQLCGRGAAGDRAAAIAAFAAALVGLRLSVMPAEVIPAAPAESEALTTLWQREAMLSSSALLVDARDLDHADAGSGGRLRRFIDGVGGVVVVAGTERLRSAASGRDVTLDLEPPSAGEQERMWRDALGARGDRMNGAVARLVSQFTLSPTAIRSACDEALGGEDAAHEERDSPARVAQRLWSACRSRARPRLGELAQHIEPAAGWDSLILPEAHMDILRDVVRHVRHRATVYREWGFASRGPRGLGVSALFHGPSGTGKTLAAEILAHELEVDLYRIDLSQVVSKYIGETEKNLGRLFDAAEEGGVALLFDEADALFGKRSEVKDSHDRYANIEVSYLLQRMEAYRGLAILTTNLKGALDTAFLRRIRFVVAFPFPDRPQREAIWRRIFPGETPTEGLDHALLSRLNVTGGSIRNIALSAAFLAAEAGGPLRMGHLLDAARREYAKLEKTLTEVETRGWA